MSWTRASGRVSNLGCVGWGGNPVNGSPVQPRQQAAAPNRVEVIDPVCGMQVNNSSPHVAEFEDQQYAFCSAGCRTKFVADPAIYIRARKSSASVFCFFVCCVFFFD